MTSLCGYQQFLRGISSTMANSKCTFVVRLMLRPTSPAIPHPPTAVVGGDAGPDRRIPKGRVETLCGAPALVRPEPPFDGLADTSGPAQNKPGGTCTLFPDVSVRLSEPG